MRVGIVLACKRALEEGRIECEEIRSLKTLEVPRQWIV